MKDISTKAVVTSPSGFYYREEHEWRGLPPEMSDYFLEQQKEIVAYITKASSNKKVGDLSATLDANYDGVPQPRLTVTGFTRQELSKFQRMVEKIGSELIRKGEDNAKAKGK